VEKEKGSGIVKAVLSGDRIEVYVDDTTKRTTWVPPQTKELKLSNIKAPLPRAVARGDFAGREEEPFAFASRSFLRELCIGKRVSWIIDGKDARREYATVHIQGEPKSLAESVVEAGLADVSLPPNAAKEATRPAAAGDDEGEKKERRLSEAMQKLVTAQEEAKSHERGKWTTSKDELAKAVPRYATDSNPTDFYTRNKGKKLPAVVEAVLSGSMLRVLLVPSFREVVVRVAGAQAPATRRGQKEEDTEPFAKEAQWTTERYTLHRRVHVTFTAFEPGKEADDRRPAVQPVFHADIALAGKSVGELLLASGLAKFVDWTAPKDKADVYRNLEAQAQAKKLRIWSSHVPTAQEATSARNFVGLVKEVPSGSTLVVVNESVKPPQVVRVTMSSIDVPKLSVTERAVDNARQAPSEGAKAPATNAANATEYAEAFALEAREFVRQKLIGRRVNVTLDYVRAGKAGDEKNPKSLPERAFYTVSVKGKNIALALVENGLAKVVEHFGQQQRSPEYDALFLAQQRAQKKKLGVHGPVQNKHYINDVSRNPKKAKAVYPTVVRQGVNRVHGVVEYVISGSRLKVAIPKDNLVITVALAGARAESVAAGDKAKTGGDKAKAADAASNIGEEARKFTRDLVHHHDVELEVEGQDRTGAFRAHVFIRPRGGSATLNLGVELLKEGLAQGARTERYADEHRRAENEAKAARKRTWADWDPEKEEAEKKARDEAVVAAGKPRKELVTVTEVVDGSTFFVQVVGEEQKQLETLMASVAAKGYENAEPYTPKAGEAVAAQFSGDNAWYRARVGRVLPPGEERSQTEIEVLYADYGNAETVPVSRVRKLDPEHSTQALRWQAREASLAFIVPRPVEDDWGKEAALYFKELVWDRQLLSTTEYREADREYRSLWISDDYTFVNAELLRAGLAKLPKRLPRGANKEIIDFLRAAQEEAFRTHSGIWEYGDDGDDDDFAY